MEQAVTVDGVQQQSATVQAAAVHGVQQQSALGHAAAVRGGNARGVANAQREERARRTGVPEHQCEGARHRGRAGGSIREGGKKHDGSERGTQDGSLNSTARGLAGPFSGNDDTRERKRRGTVTKVAERRQEKKRTRELEDTARGPAGPYGGDDDTRERKKMETKQRRRRRGT